MPWHVEHRDDEWCVIKDSDGSPVACHDSETGARAQVRALYANEPKASSVIRLVPAGTTHSPRQAQRHDIWQWLLDGADGRIPWGDEGAFRACVDLVEGKVDDPEALCGAAKAQVGAVAEPCCESCGQAHTARVTTAPLDSTFPVPEYPPAEWFDRPDWLQPGQGLTITDDGQVAGYFFEKGTCILDGTNECWTPPPSPTKYAAFHQQAVVTDDGEELRVGVIGQVGGHADVHSSPSSAQAHYADPGCVKIVCRAGDDEHGAWIAGAVVPGLTYRDVALLRRSGLSGDWRVMDESFFADAGADHGSVRAAGGYDCIGPTLVNRPGLPLLRAYRGGAVYLGGMAGVQEAAADPDKPYGDVRYADPGYKEGRKRYPIDTEAHVRAAWSYINQEKNQAGYTAEQVSNIKGRIRAAAKRFGIEIAEDKAAMAQTAAPNPFSKEAQDEHEFVDENGDGKCDVCGKTEEAHMAATAAADGVVTIELPEGVDAATLTAAIQSLVDEHTPKSASARIDELEARVAELEEEREQRFAAALAALDERHAAFS